MGQKQHAIDGQPPLDPGKQFGMIGMGRIIVDRTDPGADRNLRSMNGDFFCPRLDHLPQRAARLMAHKQDGRVVADQIIAQMVLDPPRIGHARG